MHCRIYPILVFSTLAIGGAADLAQAQESSTRKTVKVAACRSESLPIRTVLQAEVEPIAEAAIVPLVSGRIRHVAVQLGQQVDLDTVLLEIDSPETQASLAMAKAGEVRAAAEIEKFKRLVEVAEQSVRAAESRVTVAERAVDVSQAMHEAAEVSLQRVRSLFESDAATDEELEHADMGLKKAVADLAAAHAEVEARRAETSKSEAEIETSRAAVGFAEAGLEVALAHTAGAQAQDELTRVRSPFAHGRVTMQSRFAGAAVMAGETEVLHVIATDRVRIQFSIPARDAAWIAPGTPCRIIRSGMGDVDAKVTRIAGAMASRTRTMTAEIELPNADNAWLPGSLCRVEVTAMTAESYWVLESALFRAGADTHLFIAKDGVARRQKVQPGMRLDGRVQIPLGLSAGDLVITSNPAQLQDGDAVKTTSPDSGVSK